MADFLGVTKQTISNWYARNSIDYDIIITKCMFIDEKIDLKWLLTATKSCYDDRETDDKNLLDAMSYIKKDYDSRNSLITTILEDYNYLSQSEQTEELYNDIATIYEYAQEHCLTCQLNELYRRLKKNEISIDAIKDEICGLINEDTLFYQTVSPYNREIKALCALIMLQLHEETITDICQNKS